MLRERKKNEIRGTLSCRGASELSAAARWLWLKLEMNIGEDPKADELPYGIEPEDVKKLLSLLEKLDKSLNSEIAAQVWNEESS